MATSGQLVSITAKALRVPAVSVLLHYRELRGAGLVSKSGRGVSASHMTALDAARLLIAMMGARIAKEVPDTVRTVGQFRQTSSEVDLVRPVMPSDALQPGHCFEDGLAKVLSDLAGVPVTRSTVDQHIALGASVSREEAVASLTLADGFLRYEGEPTRPSRAQGMTRTSKVYADALVRISRSLPPTEGR